MSPHLLLAASGRQHAGPLLRAAQCRGAAGGLGTTRGGRCVWKLGSPPEEGMEVGVGGIPPALTGVPVSHGYMEAQSGVELVEARLENSSASQAITYVSFNLMV